VLSRRLPPILVAALAVLLLAAGSAQAADGVPCPRHVHCRTVTVPLDRSGEVPGSIALHVGIWRARRATRAPIVALAGGPGQATVPFTEDFADELGANSVRRDIITLDTRGTGWSGLVRCLGYERAFVGSETASATSCARELGNRHAFYTSADVAADIDAVRRRLRVPKIALYGVSYGTRVALEYARRYPQHTDRVILDSPLENGGSDAFSLATSAAIPRVLHRICEYGCGGSRHPIADLRSLAAQLRQTPLRRWIRDGRSQVMLDFTADDLYTLLVTTDLFVPLMQAFPIVVEEALKGHYAALIGLKRAAKQLDALGTLRDFSPGLFAATLCEESPTAWDRTADPVTRQAQMLAALAAVPDAAVSPFDRTAALHAGLWPVCGHWPAPTRPVQALAPLPDVPFLVLSGELDLRTPLEGAQRLEAQLPDAQLVMEPGWGHDTLASGLTGCVGPASRRFLRGQPLTRCRLAEELAAKAAATRSLRRSHRAPRSAARAPLPGRG
jgi:pimeloyl-ACP methyl ester carboxylesterase